MPELKLVTPYRELRNTRPKLEEMIPVYLNGDVKQAVRDFVECCKAN